MIHLRPLAALLLGAIAAAAIQPLMPTGWWLNSGTGVALASLVLFALAAIVCDPESHRSAIALWIGTILGTSAMLFRVGPGTIFPIVVVFGAIWSAAMIGAGVFARTWILKAIHRRPDSH